MKASNDFSVTFLVILIFLIINKCTSYGSYGSQNYGYGYGYSVKPNFKHVVDNSNIYTYRGKQHNYVPNSYGGGSNENGRSSYGGSPQSAGSYGEINNNVDIGSDYGKSRISKYVGGCNKQPPAPLHAGLRCSPLTGCKADCKPDYHFPDGKTRISIICENGEWKVADADWDVVPSCQPICNPQCENNGICVEPNTCSCPERYSGAMCEFENKPCLEYPEKPKHARRQCRKKMCTMSCKHGYEFPDGSSIFQYECKNGLWVAMGEKWETVPDCQAVCSPPCQNGGNCLGFNICQCPTDFRGPQCQYSTSSCDPKILPFNGGYNCTSDMTTLRCSLTCPDGISFQYPPETAYSCTYSAGVFTPDHMPQCVYPSSSFEDKKEPGMHRFVYEGNKENVLKTLIETTPVPVDKEVNNPALSRVIYHKNLHNVINILPKKGNCYAWNANHYKTFDGKVYSFESQCPYVLIRDSQDNTFSIVVQNSPNCFDANTIEEEVCFKNVKIYIDEKEYELTRSENGLPVFVYENKVISIPGQLPGIRISRNPQHSIVVLLDTVGAKITWDGQQLVDVEARENLWKRTEGLCGNMDGTAENDIITRDGRIPENVITMASSWKVEELGEECLHQPLEEHACLKPIYGSDSIAALYCNNILEDPRFAACAAVIDTNVILDSCKYDYCACKYQDPAKCVCPTIEIFVKECKQMGVGPSESWRDESICPMHCTGGKIYMPCGPSMGQKMCGSTILFPDEEAPCLEGCYCPQGTVLHDGRCITEDLCPCKQRGKEFLSGARIQKDCNTCTCVAGKWICTEVSCGARCAAVGDPHYITFDGRKFDFMGQCTYYLVKADTFSIEAENVACAGSISMAMNFPVGVAEGLPSCTKTVTIRSNGQEVKLKQNHNVDINGIDTTLPYYSRSGIDIRMASSIFLKLELGNRVSVWWDGATRVYIDLPGNFTEKIRGLCGTFNQNQNDDFLTFEGDVEHSVIPFCNKMKTNEFCENIEILPKPHPCDLQIYNKAKAESYCDKIKSDIFKACHWFVDPEQYYQDCLFDMCSCRYQVSQCLCPTISAYATECSRKGVFIKWRNQIRECGIQCTGGQTYQVCGNECQRSCDNIASNKDCKPQCVEGCNCPPGETLDNDNECIPIGKCKCEFQGLRYPAGAKRVQTSDTRGREICTCVHANWQCEHVGAGQIPDNAIEPFRCNTSGNFEFTICEDVEPVTCKNMHLKERYSPAICHPGCNCKTGYVLDTTNGICVKPTDCPCHHGGQSYKEQATVNNECNMCVCQGGRWKCTNRQCSAQCSAWGDSHFQTFDGRYYDYQGQCDYVMSKGTMGSYSFDISMQVVPCGSLGTSCPKAVTVRLSVSGDFESVSLTQDKPLPVLAKKKYMVVRQKSYFVIVEAPDLGLRLQWDKGTRIYIKLNPEWKGKVRGLCGNYNGDAADDFQTPSGGPPEVLPIIFGDSWRLQPYCPEAQQLVDTCEGQPNRRVWALKQCGLLKSSVFEACHTEVPIDNYFQCCVFDSCACDEGGDCGCLCTALAAYAQECNNKGIPIKWRSQETCPMQCDKEEFVYSPCITTCELETCDNLLSSQRLKSCESDTCIEGCSPPPCPPDHIYLDSSYKECVPKSKCKPICLEIGNITFYEGDLMEEDVCHTCHCSQNAKVCVGLPCTTVEYSSTAHPMDQLVTTCQDGWTEWINQDVAKPLQIKRNDIELLPSATVLSHLPGPKCDTKFITSIQCRTVTSHIPAKESGHDVECSLERGLFCQSHDLLNSPCPDFEVRVLCECSGLNVKVCDVLSPFQAHPTNCQKYMQCLDTHNGLELIEQECGLGLLFNPITTRCEQADQVFRVKPECLFITSAPPSSISTTSTTNICGPGMVYNECAIICENLCTDYLYSLRKQGYCLEGVQCEPGCTRKDKPSCPHGHLLADENRCVAAQNCMCSNENLSHLKPGEIVMVSQCVRCQCALNFIECFDSCSVTPSPPTAPYSEPTSSSEWPTPHIIAVPHCSQDDYIDLVQGDMPLPDEAFQASSVIGDAFRPQNARFKHEDLNSGGSWVPLHQNRDQYLEINLGRQEPVIGLKLKGSALYNEYVTSYKVSFTYDNSNNFAFLLNEDGEPMIFRGSYNSKDKMQQLFEPPFEAYKIRIHPNTWYGQIALRVEVIGCRYETFTSSTTFKPSPAICDDEMGLQSGLIHNQQISSSSDFSLEYSKNRARLNDADGWVPMTSSPNEWIMFDLTEPRILTGLVTKGGELGWITAFKVYYSEDISQQWNPILELDMRHEKVFIGNYDGYSPQVNQFDLPIHARFLKIVPYKWNHMIQLRLELHGCFEHYNYEQISALQNNNACPNICPEVHFEGTECNCYNQNYFNGEKCVDRTECPCVQNGVAYNVGAAYKKNCDLCICKIGGQGLCSPPECPHCENNKRSILTSTCTCACEMCPEGTRLCPSSNICIDKNLWCNGLVDCPDDEIGCITLTTPSTQITPDKGPSSEVTEPTTLSPVCPVITCPRAGQFKKNKFSKGVGYRKSIVKKKPLLNRQLKLSKNSSLSDGNTGYTKTGFVKTHKTLAPDHSLPRPKYNEKNRPAADTCPEFRCVYVPEPNITECPPVECGPDSVPMLDPDQNLRNQKCPGYICEPQPMDANCTITGNSISTLDDSHFKFDICYHIIGRDLGNMHWQVAVKKNCSTHQCIRVVEITHDDNEFILYLDLKIEFNGFIYNMENLRDISEEFTITRIGDILAFNSNKYGFWVAFDNKGNVMFGVVQQLKGLVDGLCGFFNGIASDDKRTPQGQIARTTEEFGDSWSLAQKSDWCISPSCPTHIYQEALHICNKVKEAPLDSCKPYVDVNDFISTCIETVCKNLIELNNTKKEEIKCDALETFIVQCLTNKVNLENDIFEWRMFHNCPAICPPPLVWHDCYQRRCEPDCNSAADPYACPKINNICFPGCYCPPGYVRNHDTCIEAFSCRDLECHLMPNNEIITFDENTLSIRGNCVYVLSRDKPDVLGNHVWQVLVTEGRCDFDANKNCIKKITCIYQGHKIHIYRDSRRNRLAFSIDKERMQLHDLPSWIQVTESPVKDLTLVLIESQLEVVIQYPTLGTTIRVPSHKYAGAVEGICGDGNGNSDNDLVGPNGKLITNIDDFILSWLFELPGQTRETCKYVSTPNQPSCNQSNSICDVLFDINVFGQCLNVLNPDTIYEMCVDSSCNNPDEILCSFIELYAQECAARGICIEWRRKYPQCPRLQCPIGLQYIGCTTHQQITCEDIVNRKMGKPVEISYEGCFCPEGLVLIDENKCVHPENCEVCDTEGHRPGEVWKPDKCTTCKCRQTQMVCNTEVCPVEFVCPPGQKTQRLPASDNTCCDTYLCIQALEKNTTTNCPPPRPVHCGDDQRSKVKMDDDGCLKYVCECIPREECKPLKDTHLYIDHDDVGYENVLDNSDCCPKYKLVCKKERCPQPPECPLGYMLQEETPVGHCCPRKFCQPPKDMCLFETNFTEAEFGGERPLTRFEKQVLIKAPGDHWSDGPCRQCVCELSLIGSYQSTCFRSNCLPIEEYVDFKDYELTAVPVYGQCCFDIQRVACKYKSHVYQVGETWTQEGHNPCMTMACVQGSQGIQKEILTHTCDKKCAPGYVYREPLPSSDQCCGYCEQVACVADGVVHQVGDQWTLDYCTNFTCVGTNGSVQVASFREPCEPVPLDMHAFVYDVTQGKCCKIYEATACRDGQNIYPIGESWHSSDDLCKSYVCVEVTGGQKRLEIEVYTEKCHMDCPLGWAYQKTPNLCCGKCVQTYCIHGGVLKNPGDIWQTPDRCTTYSCESINGELVITAAEEKCPSITCEKQDQYQDGCCVKCHWYSQNLTVLCTKQAKPLAETVGLITVNRFPEGKCVNTEPIQGFTECHGPCDSSTKYDASAGSHKNKCKCCQASAFTSVDVALLCENGRRWTKSVKVPSKCECLSCQVPDAYEGIMTAVPLEYRKQQTSSDLSSHPQKLKSLYQGLNEKLQPTNKQQQLQIPSVLQRQKENYRGLETEEPVKVMEAITTSPKNKRLTQELKKEAKTKKLLENSNNTTTTKQEKENNLPYTSQPNFSQFIEKFQNEDRKVVQNKTKGDELNRLMQMLEQEKQYGRRKEALQENNEQEFEQQLDSWR